MNFISPSTHSTLPWYGVGTPYCGEDPDTFMRNAGLDWQVKKTPTFFLGDDGELHRSSKYALIRTDNNVELSSVTQTWEEAQNSLLRDFVFDFSKHKISKKITPHSAGELDNGKIVWITAHVNESVDLFNGQDQINSYLLFVISHIYGKSISISYLPSIMRCSNVIRKMLGARSRKELEYRINHRATFDPEIAAKTLNLVSQSMTEYADLAEYLGSKRFTNDTLQQFLKQVFPTQSNDTDVLSRSSKTIIKILDEMPNADVKKGSWWAALNAITYYTNHVHGKTQNKRWESLIEGTSRAKNTRAFELAQEYAEMA